MGRCHKRKCKWRSDVASHPPNRATAQHEFAMHSSHKYNNHDRYAASIHISFLYMVEVLYGKSRIYFPQNFASN